MAKKIIFRIATFLVCLMLLPALAIGQSVSGTVTDASSGEPMPGVNVVVEGTTIGISTDMDGSFELEVPSLEETLVFTFIGFQTQEIALDGRSTIEVSLAPQIVAGDEVVVTAFGLEEEKRSVTYSTQTVDTENLAQARELNVATSLTGKVAGMSVTQSSSGLGADSRIILRGNRSIAGSSQPLFILDGVPIRGSINDINPDDIENIEVLKGPNAAALYGSEAQNGAIIISSKRGERGRTQVSLSNTFQVMDPMNLIEYQNQYGQGTGGVYNNVVDGSWGPRMEGQQVETWSNIPDQAGQTIPYSPQPNNIDDIMQTGYNNATNLSANIGGERTQSVFSYTYTDAEGIIPGQTLNRHNASLRITSQLTDNLDLDARLSYANTQLANQYPIGGTLENPFRQIYRVPRNFRTQDLKQYEYLDGTMQHNYMNVFASGTGVNPYWNINNMTNDETEERVIAIGSLRYSFTDNVSLQVRGAYDAGNSFRDDEIATNSYGSVRLGQYRQFRNDGSELNTDFLLSYNGDIIEDWSLSANIGGNYKQERNKGLSVNTGQLGLEVPNFFTLGNTGRPVVSQNIGSPQDVASIYGFGEIGWRDQIFLDFSGRNDWSSTLPPENWSYFYPSLGLSMVLSDMVNLPDWVTFSRIRGSWSKVGNSASAFQLQRYLNYNAGGNGGFLSLETTLPAEDLKPEETVGIEFGADLRLLNDRLGFDFTYYKTNTRNQLFQLALPSGSGASNLFTNGGDIENKGFEFVVNIRPVETTDFVWDLDINYSANDNKVVKINDERPILTIGGGFLQQYRIVEGRPFGELYSKGFQRVDNPGSQYDGAVIVGSNGVPLDTPGQNTLVANYNPDWLGGISNTFNYKNVSLSFLIDHRQGGSVASFTNAIIDADGVTKKTLKGRDGGLVFGDNIFSGEQAVMQTGTDASGNPVYAPNTNATNSETFWRNLGGRNAPVGEAFVEEATNTRLRELTIGYSLPQSWLEGLPSISNMRISFVGRNLFYIYRASDSLDPDQMPGTGKTAEGISAFAPAPTRNFGASINIDF